VVRIDYNPTNRCLRICEEGYILDDGFTTIAKRLSESTAHLFTDYVDASEIDDEVFDSVKSMRSFFNEWRDFIYNDDY
jgi:hypothetical protein